MAVGGGDAAGAGRAAQKLAGSGVEGLISFGLAGGLDPTLLPGAILVPDRVISDNGAWPTDPALARRLGPGVAGTIFGDGTLVATVSDKRTLRGRTGAVAVDLESAAVASAAAAAGLPFAVLRAVCDPGDAALPPAALAAIDGGGRIGIVRILASVLAHPEQLPALVALAAHAAHARAALTARLAELSLRTGG